MKHSEDTWGWMLAVDFFFAGMGGGMLLIAGIAEMFFGQGATSLLGNILAPVFIIIGVSFLTFELGRPFQAWRVFMNPKSVMTIGSWFMTLAIIFGLIYASFGIDVFPWVGWIAIRKIVAIICIISGLVVAAYPGILLGQHKARPFWTGTGMLTLFTTSSLVTGAAAFILSGLIVAPAMPGVLTGLPFMAAGLLAFQLITWLGYVWIKNNGMTEREADAAEKWLSGEYSSSFKYGFLTFGTLLPLVLFLMDGAVALGVAAVLVLLGGFLMRVLVANSGSDRTWLPGEQKYFSRLPVGDEDWLKAWNVK